MKLLKYIFVTIFMVTVSYINLNSAEGLTSSTTSSGATAQGIGSSSSSFKGLSKSSSSQGNLNRATSILQKKLSEKGKMGQDLNEEAFKGEGIENQEIGKYPSELIEQLKYKKKKNFINGKTNLEISSLEKSFLNRISDKKLKVGQFGYNFFRGRPRLTFSIPVDKNYILGPGDELFIYIIGGTMDSNLSRIRKLVVDREGKIYMPGIGVFYVWGLTLGEAENIISKALSANIKLTVGRLRTFPIYVSGEVNKPGAEMVTGVNTVIDALMMAGGIKKTGTLRDIIITKKQNNKIKKYHIDFYKLLLKGEQIDFRLKDNDVIFVKPIGKTVAIIGKVKRPAIYEIKNETTLKDLINLAGGLLPSSYKLKVSLDRYKENLYIEMKEGSLDNNAFINQKLKDGDIISIKEVINVPQNAVEISGYTTYPGLYEYKREMKLSEILKNDLFFKDSNMNFALIKRQFPTGTNPKYITFSPSEILSNKGDMLLAPADKIFLFKYNFLNLNIKKVKNVVIIKGYIKHPSLFSYKQGLTLSQIFDKTQLNLDTNRKFAVIIRHYPFGLPPKYITFIPEDILNKKKDVPLMPADIVVFYKFGKKDIDFNQIKNVVVLEGETLYPGVYTYKNNMNLSDILNKNIFTLNTDLNYGEIERRDLNNFKITDIIKFNPEKILNNKENITLQKLDVVRLFPRHIFAPIKITGEVEKSIIVPYHFGIKLTDALSKARFLRDLKSLKVEIFREASKNKGKTQLEKAENIKIKAEGSGEMIQKNITSIFLFDLLIAQNNKLNIPLNPGDRLLIKKISKDEVVEKVEIQGYVKRPGIYSISENTTLYEILKQAGGFRDNAYPDGIIFTRESIKEMEQQRLNKAILEMKQEIDKEQAGIMQSDLESTQKNARKQAMDSKRRLLDLMQQTNVNGRISGLIIPEDIEKLKNTISDIYLANGDKIYIPKKPASVLIFGEVYNPSALIRIKDYKVKDYISDAGGLTKDADIENIFVIKPNGAVITSSNIYKGKHWQGRNPTVWGIPFLFSKNIMNYKLDSGDAIIVPLKINVPIFWRPLLRDVMQIIYQSALTTYTVVNLKD